MTIITKEQIISVRSDPTTAPEVTSRLEDPGIAQKPLHALSDQDWADLHDACLETLINEAPIVESFDAEQDKGVYSVDIRGIDGAYFVQAIEFDDLGIFSSLEEARNRADLQFGEFRVNNAYDQDE